MARIGGFLLAAAAFCICISSAQYIKVQEEFKSERDERLVCSASDRLFLGLTPPQILARSLAGS